MVDMVEDMPPWQPAPALTLVQPMVAHKKSIPNEAKDEEAAIERQLDTKMRSICA
jgi:hypothetical protein